MKGTSLKMFENHWFRWKPLFVSIDCNSIKAMSKRLVKLKKVNRLQTTETTN